MATYPLARQGVYRTVQGEGVMLGIPMAFVRLAGCSVGCPECDTDYRVVRRAAASEIAREVADLGPHLDWVWLTGGEPTDHDLRPLVEELRRAGYRIALATAGTRPVTLGSFWGGVDFVSVSPHRLDDSWVLRRGDQLNLVPGLNGLRLEDWRDDLGAVFVHRWVTPCWYTPADRAERLRECMDFVQSRPGWRLGIQAHRHWNLP